MAQETGGRRTMNNINVRLVFDKPTEDQLMHIHRAEAELAIAGVTFDSGTDVDEGKVVSCDWELDWSLRGARIVKAGEKLMADDNTNVCCPFLQIVECGDTDEHKHLLCPMRTTCKGQKLMPNSTVKRLCLEDYKTCNHYILSGQEIQ